MGRKYNSTNIHLQIDSIEGFYNDNHTGFIIQWCSDIGFGEYTLYRNIKDTDFKLYADSECMDKDDDKEFVSELLKLLVKKIIVCE